jgi:hypothetical protein
MPNEGDPFTDPGMWVVLITVVLLAIFSLSAVAAVYYGDEVAVPSWNEHAVPPVKTI